jgi:hypothetical protein
MSQLTVVSLHHRLGGTLWGALGDRGVQFATAVCAAVMSRLGIKHTMTMAFHP